MERAGHEAFAESRRYAYVPRQSYLQLLDGSLSTEGGGPLVIHAPSGAGKSALLAYWGEEYRRRHPGAFLVEHYIGNGASRDHLSVIRHVLLEIRERCELHEDFPSTPEGLESAFAAWLWYVRPDDPMILMIDALNQLSEKGRGVWWLPERLPEGVRCLVTTTDQSTVEELVARGWDSMSLKPFTLKERQQVVERFMAERSTAITSEQAHGVVKAVGSANPLLLRTRLEEVERAPRREGARDTIAYYLGARDLDELHERMLVRLEGEFDHDLVATVLPLVHLSRSGLTRAQLARIAARKLEEVDRLVDRLSFHFLDREGRLGYVHEYLRRAVERRYLTDDERVHILREGLIAELTAEPVTTQSALETAVQLAAIGDDARLRDYLADIDVAMALQGGEAKYEFLIHWKRLGEAYDIVQVYRQSLQRYREERIEGGDLFRVLNSLGLVMENVGRLEGARTLQEEALALAERLEDPSAIARAAGDLGLICYFQGKRAQAMEYYQLQYTICEQLEDEVGLAPVLSRMAAIHFWRAEYDSARSLTMRRLEISNRINDRRGIAMCYGGLASICHNQGETDRAREHFERQLEITREIGDRRLTTLTLGNLGVVYEALNEHERAEGAYQEQLRIAEEIGDRMGVASAIGHMADAWRNAGRVEEALPAYRRQLVMAKEIGDPGAILSAYRGITSILNAQDSPEIGEVARDWLQAAREAGRRDVVAKVARFLAELEEQEGNPHEAEKWRRLASEESEE